MRSHQSGLLDWLFHHPVIDVEYILIHSVSSEPINGQGVANEVSCVALSWNQVGESPNLAWWAPGSTAPTAFTLPPDMLGITLMEVTDSGLIIVALLTQSYQFRPFIARHGDGPRVLEHRVIGLPLFENAGLTNISESGHMLYDGGGGIYGPRWILTPAGPGDVDGDGLVGITDVLLIIAAWGELGDTDPCGPDLNLDGEVGADDLLQVLANWS